MIYERNEGSLRDQKLIELLRAENFKLKAATDYLSMMTGFDILVDEETQEQEGDRQHEQI